MKLKSIKVGSITLKNNVLLAPVAGFTDFSFRKIAFELGAALCFTELVSAKGLVYDSKKTITLLQTHPQEQVKAAQLFGAQPDIMLAACQSQELEKFDIIDINMGCPVPKLFKCGEGSALIDNMPLAAKIIKECVKSGKIITVKTRIGITKGKEVAADFAKMCQDSGAAMLTIHGRTRDMYYSGDINYKQIQAAKNSVQIPVIANGGIFTQDDAREMLDKTGADGVMLSRGALQNPLLIAALSNTYTNKSKKDLIIEQINLLIQAIGQARAAVVMRKRIAYYLKGAKNAVQYKTQAFECDNAHKLIEIIENAFM